jgi:exodeoxyribonuclease V alpha subunit
MSEWTSGLPWKPHERALAQWAARRWGFDNADWPSGLALLVAAEDDGHTALVWDRAPEIWNRRFANEDPVPPFTVPAPEEWPAALFDGWLRLGLGRLVQTERNHQLETALAASLTALAAGNAGFRPETGQDAAVGRAGQTRLLILAGGPGTGKTTTLKRLVAAWTDGRPDLRVALAAPTGRAAARAAETFGGDVRALTVHRLLGLRPGLGRPRHDAEHPLPFDLVIVDEASMLDLRTAAALTDALPGGASLVLVGDPGQLPSVEAGSVLSSLLERPEFASSTVRLVQRFRLEESSRSLAAAFDLLAAPGGPDDAEKLLALSNQSPDFRWEVLADGEDPGRKTMAAWGPRPASLATLNQTILLSPVHDGPGGTRELSALADRALGRPAGTVGDGLPWMITRNLPHLGLSNGDRGLVVRDGGLWFESEGRRRWPFALVAGDGQAAWAVTVHKSQGSEFDRVVLTLPPRDSGITGRELLYTALTRARSSAVLVASMEAVRAALGRRQERMSGLN